VRVELGQDFGFSNVEPSGSASRDLISKAGLIIKI
jgi:hypothetical protein